MCDGGTVFGKAACQEALADGDVREEDLAAGGRGDLDYGDPLSDKPVELLTPREVGLEGERLALQYLRTSGLSVVRRNWRTALGEADVVCRDGDTVVLVEVKTRLALGERSRLMPELAVDDDKQHRYGLLALEYLVGHPSVRSVRFDVIAISITGDYRARLRHLVGAFAWDD